MLKSLSAAESRAGRNSSIALTDPPAFASATAAAKAIRQRTTSSEEITSQLLRRIDRFDPELNAVVTVDAEGALECARFADLALGRNEVVGPLHGVPCCVKDAFETKGMRTTAGSASLHRYIPDDDADVVARLRRAGAIILGKTNTPAMGGDWQTYNDVFGTTNNPWDVSLTPGGSSGGAAAALAAGLDFLGVASDLSGSIRGPAHFCGVYGHKCSLNLVSLRGHIPPRPPLTGHEYQTLAVGGAIARAVEDLRLAVTIIGGPHGDAAKAYRWQMPAPRRERLVEYRIGYVLDDPACAVSSETRELLERAVSALRAAGVHLREGWPEGVVPTAQRETFEYLKATYRAKTVTDEQMAALRRRPADGTETDIFARAVTDPIGCYQRALTAQAAARATWQRFFERYDAFLLPVTFLAAFPHDHTLPQSRRQLQADGRSRSYLDLTFWCSFASLAGLPATVAPVGFTSNGLPVGIQILGPYLEDATPIDVAAKLALLLDLEDSP